MLASSLVDAVDICLPHHLHADAIVAAAEAGLHVLCEKPLCLTIDEAHAVQTAVSAAGITLMCAHNQLFLPPVAAARKLLKDGILGTVYEARTTDSFYNDLDPNTMGWRAHRSTSGRRRAHRHRVPPDLSAAPPDRQRAGRGRRDAQPAPADVHGGRGLRPGRGPLRRRVDRHLDDQLGVRAGRLHREVLRRRRSRQPVERRRGALPPAARRRGRPARGPARRARSRRSPWRSSTSWRACARGVGRSTPRSRASTCSR